MPFTVHYDQENNCIKVSVKGELNLVVLQKMAAAVSEVVRKVGCKYILNDLRRASVPENAFYIYGMPETARKSGITPKCKRALLVGDRASNFYFLETVFLNSGHQVKMFETEEAAYKWLFEDDGDKNTT